MSHGESHDLTVSLHAVHRARSMLDLARTQEGLSRAAITLEQRRLLEALEGHAVNLASHGHPMPYRMRSELAMYRAMCSTTRPPTR